jgi:hypothetical protein
MVQLNSDSTFKASWLYVSHLYKTYKYVIKWNSFYLHLKMFISYIRVDKKSGYVSSQPSNILWYCC